MFVQWFDTKANWISFSLCLSSVNGKLCKHCFANNCSQCWLQNPHIGRYQGRHLDGELLQDSLWSHVYTVGPLLLLACVYWDDCGRSSGVDYGEGPQSHGKLLFDPVFGCSLLCKFKLCSTLTILVKQLNLYLQKLFTLYLIIAWCFWW